MVSGLIYIEIYREKTQLLKNQTKNQVLTEDYCLLFLLSFTDARYIIIQIIFFLN
jgi:hypothetical protein